jgi:hypothetical protein
MPLSHRYIKRTVCLSALVLIAACADTKSDDSKLVTIPTVELGQACVATADCVGEFLCMTIPAGRVCVQSCQEASECGQADAQCTLVAGVDVGWCGTSQDLPMADPPMDESPMDQPPMDDPPVDDPPVDDPPVGDPPIEEPPAEDPNVRASYPDGPFGTMLGDVVENHSMVDPNGDPVTLGDLRTDASVKLLLIFSTVTYCRGCQAKTVELTELYNELGSRGLLPVVTLYENNNHLPTVAADARSYRGMLGLQFPVIADGADVFQRYFAERGHPMILVLDAEDMSILYKRVHWRRDDVEAVIREHL